MNKNAILGIVCAVVALVAVVFIVGKALAPPAPAQLPASAMPTSPVGQSVTPPPDAGAPPGQLQPGAMPAASGAYTMGGAIQPAAAPQGASPGTARLPGGKGGR